MNKFDCLFVKEEDSLLLHVQPSDAHFSVSAGDQYDKLNSLLTILMKFWRHQKVIFHQAGRQAGPTH